MVEIMHRTVNGTEVSCHDLSQYHIKNQTILDIVQSAIWRNENITKEYQNTPDEIKNNSEAVVVT